MDFDDTAEEAAFRVEVHAWLAANAPPARHRRGDEARLGPSAGNLDESRAWQAKKAAKGYARMTWAKELGGRGGTAIQQVIYNQEEAKFDVPSTYAFSIGLGMCIPTLMAYGSKETIARYVAPALKGEEIWCQLFSEPAAGSDVAGLRMRAVRDGNGWTINGQKIWTSGAHYSDFGLLLARTDFDAPKHKGLTMFFLSMRAPGVEVRPIRQATGGATFNEVFFTDVRIPDSQRLGEVGQGWTVALTTLMHERLAVGGGQGGNIDVKELLSLARHLELEDGPALKDAHVREKIADWYVRSAGLKYTTYRTMTALSRGQQPGPEASIAKVVVASKLQELCGLATELESEAGALKGDDAPAHGAFQLGWMSAPGFRIAGGTDEILRNIIAERVLGLPSDIRVDKDVPFNKVPGEERKA
jgi:acyl-CoA dehydrogenase